MDTQKLGLWPGGFFKVSADTGFGSNAFQDAGTIVPVNTAALLPAPDDRITALTNATVTQFFSPQFGVTAGKFYLLDAGETEFYGDYRTQFMNTAFNFPMTLALFPLSTFGGGVVVLPRDDILLSGLAIGPNSTPTSNNVGQAFHGVLIVSSAKLTVKPFGLVGHQSLGVTWNNEDRFSLDQDPSNIADLLLNEQFPLLANPGPVLTQILASRFPNLLVPTQPANRTGSSWTMGYSFDQYFWQPEGDPKHGVGVFFRVRGFRREPRPDPICLSRRHWRQGGGDGPLRRQLRHRARADPVQQQFFFPFCVSSSTSACNARMQSRCTTTWRSHSGWTLPAICRSFDSGLNQAISPTTGKLTGIDTVVMAGARLRVRF